VVLKNKALIKDFESELNSYFIIGNKETIPKAKDVIRSRNEGELFKDAPDMLKYLIARLVQVNKLIKEIVERNDEDDVDFINAVRDARDIIGSDEGKILMLVFEKFFKSYTTSEQPFSERTMFFKESIEKLEDGLVDTLTQVFTICQEASEKLKRTETFTHFFSDSRHRLRLRQVKRNR